MAWRRQSAVMNCRARCVLMLEYYITDVSAKFDGLALVSVPETDAERVVTIVALLLSGFVSIYFEMVLKSKTETFSVWDRNLQLAFYSMLIYGPCAQLVGRRRLGSVTARRPRLLGRTRQGGTGCWAALCTLGERL